MPPNRIAGSVPDDGPKRAVGRGPWTGEDRKTPGKKEGEKPGERQVTLAEVQGVINSLVQSIIKGFATKNDVQSIIGLLNRKWMEISTRYPSREEVQVIAKDAVPRTLRHLDEGNSQRQGNTLMLSPGGASAGDSAYWGTVKAPVAGGDTADWAFKFISATGAAATFNGGPVLRGTQAAVDVTSDTLTITATGQIVYVVYTLASGTAGFGVANADNFPVSASGTYVKALQSFTLADGVITPLLTYHRGAIQIDGCYA